MVATIIRNYPLSFNGLSAVNVYPLQNDPPCPLGVFTCVSGCHKLWPGSHLAHMGNNNGLWGRLKRSARAVQLFGRLAVLETHALRY